MLTNKQLVEFCESMVGESYWFDTYVLKATEDLYQRKSKRYPHQYLPTKTNKFKNDMAQNKIVADNIGLIKGFAWTNGGEGVKEAKRTGKTFVSRYQSNNCPDKSADGMYKWALSVKAENGKISSLPEIPGIAVRYSGHIGVYIGNGFVIEEKDIDSGCVKTPLIGRGWTEWFKLPFIHYLSAKEPELGDRVLGEGDEGQDVRQLQNLLIKLNLNLPKYGINGKYNTETEKAIKRFQELYHLPITGKADKKTLDKLLNIKILKLGDRDIVEGMMGEDVEEAQRLLTKLGYSITSFGKCAEEMIKALKEFQKSQNLNPTGILNKTTLKKLLNPDKPAVEEIAVQDKEEEEVKEPAENGIAIAAHDINLYNEEDEIINTIPEGKIMEVLEITGNNSYNCLLDGQEITLSNATGDNYIYLPYTPDIKSKEMPKLYNELYEGLYAANININLRNGAGTKYSSIIVLPKDTVVESTGWYSIGLDTKINRKVEWVYVVCEYNNTKYTGFIPLKYLRNIA